MKQKFPASNERGSILVIALIMLALLTVLGLMSTNTASIDLQIAQNERIYTQNFNAAEAANMAAVQAVIDNITNSDDWVQDWVEDCIDDSTNTCTHPFRNKSYWYKTAAGTDLKETPEIQEIDINGMKAYWVVEYNGEFSGASQVLVNPDKLYKFTCYGLYTDPNRGEVLIETAMTRRF